MRIIIIISRNLSYAVQCLSYTVCFFGLLCLSDGTLFNISVIFLCQNFSQINKLTCILIIIITWKKLLEELVKNNKFRASYVPIKSLPLHLHCMPTGQPCIWLIAMSLEYMYPYGIDFVLIIICLWVQLMIYTTSDIWKFSQNCMSL